METPELLSGDMLELFGGRPDALAVFCALLRRVEAEFPQSSARAQKTQSGFYSPRLFAMASLPRRKAQRGIVVSFGLAYRLKSPRIAACVEAYPNRWTHHVNVGAEDEIDGQLMGWLREAYDFSLAKGRGRA